MQPMKREILCNEVEMKTPLPFLILVILLAGVQACRSRSEQSSGAWQVGGLYSVESGDGDFRVAKVLALDPGVVGVRLYKQKFASRPTSVDPSILTLGSMND